jgi:hypothetical protein
MGIVEKSRDSLIGGWAYSIFLYYRESGAYEAKVGRPHEITMDFTHRSKIIDSFSITLFEEKKRREKKPVLHIGSLPSQES